jgi:PIN domain nuclease of toxin-antitoxin system
LPDLLLDTHVLIWWDEGRRISRDAKRAIQKADVVFVSAASAWEIAIKTALGRLHPRRTIAEAVADSGFTELPVEFAHAHRLTMLPDLHRDPFDRMLIAQAQVEGLVLVTRDQSFKGYEVPTIEA